MQPIQAIGHTFGRLTVLEQLSIRPPGGGKPISRWRCRCACGNETTVRASDVRQGRSQSCGCLRKESVSKTHRVHGGARTPEYEIWQKMIFRCENPKATNYGSYGGRGITICARWRHDFAAFLADMGRRPSKQHSLDRIDNNGHYEPSNCRWQTMAEQSNNRRTNHLLTLNGRTQNTGQWAKELGIQRSTIENRLTRGWSVEKTLTTPLQQ